MNEPITNVQVNPQVKLTKDDLRTCPRCGCLDDKWLEENQKVRCWQGVALRFVKAGEFADIANAPEEGLVIEDDYGSQKQGDDVEVTGYQCYGCEFEWPDMKAVRAALQAAANARADAEYLERCLFNVAPEVQNALAVFVCNTTIRLTLEQTDPMALKQAREALELPNTYENGEST